MRVKKISEATPFTNSENCGGYSYSFGNEAIDLATVHVHGRYPEEGHLVNEVCTEVAYVMKGEGRIGIEEEIHELVLGTVVHIDPGERFFWQGNELELLIACNPAFDPSQHKEVQ